MAIKQTTIYIDDIEFVINSFKAMEALLLKKRTLTIFAPILSVFQEFTSFNDEVNLSKISTIIQNFLYQLDDATFERYIKDIIKNTSVMHAGSYQSLTKPEIFDTIFSCQMTTLYKLIFEIWKYNIPDFLALMGGGVLTNIITSFAHTPPSKSKSKKN